MYKKYGILGDVTIGIETAISYFLAAPHTQDRLETYVPHIGFYAAKSRHHLSVVGEKQKPIYPFMKNSKKVRLEVHGINDNIESCHPNFPNLI